MLVQPSDLEMRKLSFMYSFVSNYAHFIIVKGREVQ